MTRTSELDRYGRGMWGSRFLGTFPQDKLPERIYDKDSFEFAIINVDTSGMKGTHWAAVSGIPGSNKILVFDSFGRASKRLLPVLSRQAKKYGGVIDTDLDAEQKKVQDSCGQYALAWLTFVERYGLTNARKI